MKLRPLHDFVLLQPLDATESHGGIYIPEAYRDDTGNRNQYIRESNQWCRGRVIAVGPGRYEETEVEPGVFELATERYAPDLQPEQIVYYKRAEATPMPEGDQVLVHEGSVAFELQVPS
jgi:co-chaperonin GroES (HSP10)